MNRLLWLVFACVALSVACGDDGDGGNNGGDRVEAILALEGDATAAQANYASVCSVCHAADGSGTPSGTDLTALSLSDRDIVEVILYGKGTMPGYEGSYDDQEVADLTALVQTY
jgi:mono/diheme cytochrome c family protein